MTVTSCPASSSACERWNPISPAPATTKYTLPSLHGRLQRLVDHVGLVRQRFTHEHFPDLAVLLQHPMKERAEDGRSGERVDPHLAVGLRADWIVHLGDHLLHAEDLLSDLRRHQIAIVAFGECKERVGPFDPRLPEDFEIRTVAEDRLARE